MKSSKKYCFRPGLEPLEARSLLSTFLWDSSLQHPGSWNSTDWYSPDNSHPLTPYPIAGDAAIFEPPNSDPIFPNHGSNVDCEISGIAAACQSLQIRNGYAGTLHIEATFNNAGTLNATALVLDSPDATVSLERGAASASVNLNATTFTWRAGSLKGDNYVNDIVDIATDMSVEPAGPWVITDVGSDWLEGGQTIKIDSGGFLDMRNSTSLIVNGTGTTHLDIAGTMEFVRNDTLGWDGKGGIARQGQGNTSNSWISIASTGALLTVT